MGSILPAAKSQFFDQNGKPLAGCSVYFYIPGTSTLKDTYQDEAQTILNTNPVVLDSRGEASIWGTGVYRMVLEDASGSVIYDQVTSSNISYADGQTTSNALNAFIASLASSTGASLIGSFSQPDAYTWIAEASSFDQLRTLPVRAEGVKIHLRGYRAGSLLGGGVFIGHLGSKADNGVTVASSSGGFYWEREDLFNIDVFQAGAYGDGVTNDWTAIQSAINYVNTLALVAGAVTGAVILPFGYTYRVDYQLYLDIPIKFHCLGNLYWAAAAGYCIRVGRGVGWNVEYDIYIRNAWADHSLSFPTTWVNGGTGLLLLTSITFSTIKIDTATGFTEAVLYLWGDGALGYTQVIQHNTFNLGQIVNSGRGIRLSSLDPASSSAQANRFFIQNIYQNYDNIVMEGTATNSNTFYINAMDNCRNVGIDLYGELNYFYVGFAGSPGTALRENSTYGNTVIFGNSVPTDLSIQFGVSAHNTIQCADPGPAYLPASVSIANNSLYQNTYGVPIQVSFNVAFSGNASFDLYYGKNPAAMAVVQSIAGVSGNNLPVTRIIPPGWWYMVFTTGGSPTYGTAAYYPAQ